MLVGKQGVLGEVKVYKSIGRGGHRLPKLPENMDPMATRAGWCGELWVGGQEGVSLLNS